MKKTIYLLACLNLMFACSNVKEKAEKEEAKTVEQASTTMAETVGITYAQCPLAYLVEGKLYFHSLIDDKKIQFVEEPNAIFNFTFDTEGKIMYYNVERDNTLWLKSVDLSDSKITPIWLVDWKLKKEECITETYDEASPLFYHKGELLIFHNFSWDNYDFEKSALYSIANNKITLKESGNFNKSRFTAELSYEEVEQYFKIIRQKLYYTANKNKICLTDQLDFEAEKEKGMDLVETEFAYFVFSPGEKKILFGTLVGWGDLPHGPFSIANIDGSNQMILKQTDISSKMKPVWLKNKSIAYTDNERNLYIANNDENTNLKIAEQVSFFRAR